MFGKLSVERDQCKWAKSWVKEHSFGLKIPVVSVISHYILTRLSLSSSYPICQLKATVYAQGQFDLIKIEINVWLWSYKQTKCDNEWLFAKKLEYNLFSPCLFM